MTICPLIIVYMILYILINLFGISYQHIKDLLVPAIAFVFFISHFCYFLSSVLPFLNITDEEPYSCEFSLHNLYRVCVCTNLCILNIELRDLCMLDHLIHFEPSRFSSCHYKRKIFLDLAQTFELKCWNPFPAADSYILSMKPLPLIPLGIAGWIIVMFSDTGRDQLQRGGLRFHPIHSSGGHRIENYLSFNVVLTSAGFIR